MWRLEWESNMRPSGHKALNLALSNERVLLREQLEHTTNKTKDKDRFQMNRKREKNRKTEHDNNRVILMKQFSKLRNHKKLSVGTDNDRN